MTALARSSTRPYENPILRRTLGPALRPGGLEATRRGLDLLDPPAGARVLDLGTGPGATLDLLVRERGLRAVGLDPSPALLAEAARRGPVAAGRAEALPLAGASLAAVTCECVLSLSRDPDAALAECARVLVPGGRLLLGDLYRVSDSNPCPGPDFTTRSGSSRGCAGGAEDLATLFARLDRAGLRRIHVERRDRDLTELAARIILAHGSLEAFFGAVFPCPGPDRPTDPTDLIGPTGPTDPIGPIGPDRPRTRLGYVLVIAQKDART